MGSSTITATYDASPTATARWSWGGDNVSTGSNEYDADGPTTFTVNLVTTNVPSGTTIALLPQGVGSGYMAKFAGFTGAPLCMPSTSFERNSNGMQFTFTDNNPSYTDGNVYYLMIGIGVTANGTTTPVYSPDPVIINKDPDENWQVKIPEQPQLTAARS